jgi:hypothetical protein
MAERHIKTPHAHQILMSFDDFLFITLMINGMFQKGSAIPATSDILANNSIPAILRICASVGKGTLFYQFFYGYACEFSSLQSFAQAKPVIVYPAAICEITCFFKMEAGVIHCTAAPAALKTSVFMFLFPGGKVI